MKYSCAVIFYQQGQILIGHATGQRHWDLPKGKRESGETFKQAAVRECFEETGYVIKESELVQIGIVPYNNTKKIVFFFNVSKNKPNILDLHCSTTFINKRGIERPDIDKFLYVDVSDVNLYLTDRMCTALYGAMMQYLKTNKE